MLGITASSEIALAGDVRLSWDANTDPGVAGYKAYMGTISGKYGAPINVGNVTTYTITGLTTGTYYFAVTAYDGSGNESGPSNEVVATVSVPADTTPPLITAVASSSVTPSSAVVTWATNEQADSQIDYGSLTSYGLTTPLDGTLLTAHSQTIAGLTPGTVYHFRVRSRDSAGNVANSGDMTFTTEPILDTTPPVITSVGTSSLTQTAATVAWATNEPGDTQVEYGTTALYGSATTNPTPVTAHSQALSGLTANTTYHFRVKSKDAAGNLATSADFTFKTISPLNVGLVAAYNFDEGAGLTTADYSGNSNTGTLVNASWTKGKAGNALSFNGNNSYATTPGAALPAMNTALSIAYWLSTNSKPTSLQPVVSLGNDVQQMSIQAGYRDSKIGVWQNPGSWLVTSTPPSARAWHHVAYTYDGQIHRLYVDGVEVSTSTITPSAAVSTNLQIGRILNGSDFLKASLDELRVYNRALTAAEIQSLMTVTTP